MISGIKAPSLAIVVLTVMIAVLLPGRIQAQTSTDMEIVREKIRADKKLYVAVNMGLTETEARGFWPVYDEYQSDLDEVNQRTRDPLTSYAADYRAQTLTEAKAQALIKNFLAIEQAEVKLQDTYVSKMSLLLPAKQVARYLQIENKIRALIRYDLATSVPLVK